MLHQDPESDRDLIDELHLACAERPTYGYRRITALLRKGLKKPINHKKVYRLMKAEGLLLRPFPKRPTVTHDGKIITLKSNIRWCSDSFGIRCWNGDLVQVAFTLDCHDREVMSWVASTKGIDAEMICDMVTQSVEQRFPGNKCLPNAIQWLTDNGPCYGARKTVSYLRELGFEVCTTAPYSPESNGMAEALVKTFKRDYAHINRTPDAKTVLDQLEKWFEDYSENAPHKGLKMPSPREYLRGLNAD